MTYAQTSHEAAPAAPQIAATARAKATRARIAMLLAPPRTASELAAAAERKALADALFGPRDETVSEEGWRAAAANAASIRGRVAKLLNRH